MKSPHPGMVSAAKKIMLFMETRNSACLDNVFAAQNVILIDSFSPYLFQQENAVTRWAEGFIEHAKNLTNLRHAFGEPQEYSENNKIAFLSMPVTWEGIDNNRYFIETGGMALVFVNIEGQWKIQNYSWAATSYKLK